MEITSAFGLQNDWSQTSYDRRRQSAYNRVKDRTADKANDQNSMGPTTNVKLAQQTALSQNQTYNTLLNAESKLQKEQEYNQELEDARVNDPVKYDEMIRQAHLNSAKSIGKFMDCVEENSGKFTFRGIKFGDDAADCVEISVKRDTKELNIGDMSSGRVISVPLSNGYTLNFNRENIDDISKMLDLFTPEDINAILSAIHEDNIAMSAQQAIEEEESKVIKLAGNTENQKTVGNDENASAQKTDSSPELFKLLEDRDVEENPGSMEFTAQNRVEKENEESETTSQILLRPDGTKELVITTSVGDMEFQTSFKISETEQGKEGFGKAEQELAKEDPLSWGQKPKEPTLFRWYHAVNSYEENFSYA